MRRRRKPAAAALLLALMVYGCAGLAHRTAMTGITTPPDSIVRVALDTSLTLARFSSTSLLAVVEGASGALLGTSRQGAVLVARPFGADGVELVLPDGERIVVRTAPLVLRADPQRGSLLYDGKRFRGMIAVWRNGDRLTVVNSLPIEEYLLGVVPLEIGARRPDESAAVAAQAVSARSFTYARLVSRRRDPERRFDVVAGVGDQVYGGMDMEAAMASEQVRATRGLVLSFAGRVVEAVYSSSCGGTTADASDVWPWGGQPFLRSVSDSIPGGAGAYCDIAPRAKWSVTLNARDLVDGIDRYLRNYAGVSGRITSVDSLVPIARTSGGRVRTIALVTNAGRYELTGDRLRFVLRQPDGAILRSTLFELETLHDSGTGVARVEISGRGYGHGAGLCQWGAVGRARAGQRFREILLSYFPGTTVGDVGAVLR